MKPISYKQEMGTQKGFCAQELHRFLLGFNMKIEGITMQST